jgi:nucleotide-binding universal stress UspA family protein
LEFGGSISSKLAYAASFGAIAVGANEDIDKSEELAARQAAEEALERAVAMGFTATLRVEEAPETVWMRIVEVADEIDVAMIATGSRGRDALKNVLFGSVSHEVLAHAKRPVLIIPPAG